MKSFAGKRVKCFTLTGPVSDTARSHDPDCVVSAGGSLSPVRCVRRAAVPDIILPQFLVEGRLAVVVHSVWVKHLTFREELIV